MVELAGVILILLIEALVDVIFAQPLKTISREKTDWPSFYRFIAAKKLHYFIRPMHLGVSAPTSKAKECRCSTKRLRDSSKSRRTKIRRSKRSGPEV